METTIERLIRLETALRYSGDSETADVVRGIRAAMLRGVL